MVGIGALEGTDIEADLRLIGNEDGQLTSMHLTVQTSQAFMWCPRILERLVVLEQKRLTIVEEGV